MRGKIFVITGPSGVGKGTLCRRFLNSHPDTRLSISATSRPPRPGEENGRDYFFKSRDEFERMIARNELLEWAEYNGNYYGTPREYVESVLARGENVLLEIEVQGALMVKEQFPEACLIFITPPSMEELERRLRGRGTDDEAVIQRRLEISHGEMALKERFDHIIENDDLDRCFECLCQVMAPVKR